MASCPECGSEFQPSDNYCRECGMYLAALRLPQPIEGNVARALDRPIERRLALAPPARQLATAVAVGTALPIGLTIATRLWALRRFAAPLVRNALFRPRIRPQKRPVPDSPRERAPAVGEEAPTVHVETLIIRRWWVRRS